MVVNSEHLINAFNAVIGSYPCTNFLNSSVCISAPFHVLIHHRDALSRYRISQPSCHTDEYAATTNRHIDIILGYIDQVYGAEIREEEARHRRRTPVATFEWLWLLLKPGEVVYKCIENVWTAFVIGRIVTETTGNDDKIEAYRINCWDIRYSQERMRRCLNDFSIAAFSGEQAIHSLEVVPAAFFPEEPAKQCRLTMAENQIRIGRLYWELVKGPAYKEYDGRLVDREGLRTGQVCTHSALMSFDSHTSQVTGRVVVDAEGYDRFAFQAPEATPRGPPRMPPPQLPNGRPMPRRMAPGMVPQIMRALPQFGPQCKCKACTAVHRDIHTLSPLANIEDLDPQVDEPPKNDLYFLVCTPKIPAFIVSSRRWGHVNLECLSDVKCDTEAFKYLVLDVGLKTTVKALTGKFASTEGQVSPWPLDFVRNKGEGRIFLLHGSPGVGKTCTAECVAELTRRPLLSITSGDLLPDVERNLTYFMTLGERYGAVVLLDEADVYLEERRTRDLKRNALVSVFLRALEYYKGVLFLTTNRVESFDPAFTSRIHVALHYKRLSNEDRARIWATNFDRLERDSASQVFVSSSAREYVGMEHSADEEVGVLQWNGREIRNALQTAVALAETEAADEGLEKVGVAERHLRQVVKLSTGFKEFMMKKRRRVDDHDEQQGREEYASDEEGEDCVY